MKIIIQQLSLGNQKIIGSTYEYYVKGLDGDREFTSDTKSATITTGVKKYRYYLTSDNDERPDKLSKNAWQEVNSVGELEKIKLNSFGRYLHIYSIDGAGNESDVTKIELIPQTQNIDVTKEVINPKNEYKIGDIVTYSIKAKIRENETNKGKITNVNIVDTYNSNYLRLVNGSIVKDNNTVVNTDEVGKIKTTINELVYGKIKEIRYDMEVLNTANR